MGIGAVSIAPLEVVAAQPLGVLRRRRELLQSGRVQWSVVAAPNPGWAEAVFGEPDMERLWEAVAVSVRLDQPDPVHAWQQHAHTHATKR